MSKIHKMNSLLISTQSPKELISTSQIMLPGISGSLYTRDQTLNGSQSQKPKSCPMLDIPVSLPTAAKTSTAKANNEGGGLSILGMKHKQDGLKKLAALVFIHWILPVQTIPVPGPLSPALYKTLNEQFHVCVKTYNDPSAALRKVSEVALQWMYLEPINPLSSTCMALLSTPGF